jgi:hypothetical protein
MASYLGNLSVVESPFDGDSLQEALTKMEKFLGRENLLTTYQLTPNIWAVFADQESLDKFQGGRNEGNFPIGGIVFSSEGRR